MARSLTALPWPVSDRTTSPLSTSSIFMCLGFEPAMQTHGFFVTGSLVQTMLLCVASGSASCHHLRISYGGSASSFGRPISICSVSVSTYANVHRDSYIALAA